MMKHATRLSLTVGSLLLVLLLAGGCLASAQSTTPVPTTPTPATTAATGVTQATRAATATVATVPQTMDAVAIVKQVGPAVVTVINEQQVGGLGSTQLQPTGIGTGFIIDRQGHIVTNNHVVAGGQKFAVIFAGGTKRPAKLIGADQVSDLAVVQVDGTVPGTVSLGDSNALQPGQPVLAIGSPLGTFTNTVTEGIVSGLGRSLPGTSTLGYSNLIQHDAAINPGNSGGPLVNAAGEVVGVNTLGIPQAEPGVPAQGLFFAIPANTVKKITSQLIASGRVVYPFLGIEGPVAITDQIASQHNLPVTYGVYVQGASPGGPAAQAGIQQGDIILAIDGQRIDQQTSLAEVLFSHKPGDSVTVSVQRGGQRLDVKVKLGERPQQ